MAGATQVTVSLVNSTLLVIGIRMALTSQSGLRFARKIGSSKVIG